ncbi:MAG: leucyl aminopeptidase [Planctomycetota bacterium]
MRIRVATGELGRKASDLSVFCVAEGADLVRCAKEAVGEALAEGSKAAKANGDFKGSFRQTLSFYPEAKTGAKRILVVGLGKKGELDLERARRIAGLVVRQAKAARAKTAELLIEPGLQAKFDLALLGQALAEGATLASYEFDDLKEKPEDPAPKLRDLTLLIDTKPHQTQLERGVAWGQHAAEGANYARLLADLPPNIVNPVYLGNEAKKLSRKGLKVTVMGLPEIKRHKMGGLLAVNQGSAVPPRFMVMEKKAGASYETVCLVGKGLTFDAGGISIKPAANMDEMKYDMCGGAAVFGVMQALTSLDVPVNVVGIVPSTENLLGAAAYRPGDILTSMAGRTIEVLNTDAEGRLILVDGLAYAARYKPAAVIDMATLTGACVVALGNEASGLFGNDDKLIKRIQAAADKSGERVWHMPTFPEYDELLDSKVADVKNIGGRWAGAITAACFLGRWAKEYSWAHLDIAGTAWNARSRDYYEHGGTGVMVRTMLELLRGWQKKP